MTGKTTKRFKWKLPLCNIRPAIADGDSGPGRIRVAKSNLLRRFLKRSGERQVTLSPSCHWSWH
jgi:hypothetical protein